MSSKNPLLKQFSVEAKYIFQNPAVFLILVLAPVFYGLFYAYPYTKEVPRKVPVVVMDQDSTQLSRQLIRMIDSAEDSAVVYAVHSFDEAKEIFFDRKAYSIVLIPEGFERRLLRGEPASISLYTDGSYLLYYRQSYGAIQTVAQTLGAGVTIQRLLATGVPGYAVMNQRTSVTLNAYPMYNPIGGYATYVLPAVFVLICQQLMLVGISMIMANERRDVFAGRNVYVAPFARLSVKVITYFVLIVLQGLFLFGVALPLFKIPFNGQLIDLILLLFPYYIAVIHLGIILGSFVKVPETGVVYVASTSILLLFLSGVPWSPLAMPVPMRLLREFFPSTHGIEGFVRIFREGATLADVGSSVGALWILVVVLVPIAFWRIMREQGHRYH